MSRIATSSTNHFPQHLAKAVAQIWDHLVQGPDYDRPLLPSPQQLKQILEVCYLTTLETDEGRPLRFSICCTPEIDTVRRHNSDEKVETWSFEQDRNFNIQELRRLATTTNLDTSAIWVRFSSKASGVVKIHGMINMGSSWASARRAFSYAYSPPPSALIIRAYGIGRISVYQGSYTLATLSSGRVSEAHKYLAPFMDLLGAYPILEEGADAIGEMLVRPNHEEVRDWHEFEWLAYVNTILAIVNTIQLKGHGGAFILTSESSRIWEEPMNSIKIKYKMSGDNSALRDRFIDFMNSRHRYGDLAYLYSIKHEKAPDEKTLSLNDVEIRERTKDLSSSAAFIGGLSGVDGAIVMTSNLQIVGFGAEILMDRAPRSQVYQVNDPAQQNLSTLDSEQFGMRHRSAMRLCSTSDGVVVFIISQDGDVSLVWKKDGKVCFKKGINITNMNMILA